MAAWHYLTNKGKLLLTQGNWDDVGAGIFKAGLLQGAAVPAGIDTAGEVADLNTVTDLLGIATEVTGGTYARLVLSRSNATEDDANDRVNMDAADLVFASGANGQQTWGGFIYDITNDATDTTRLCVSVFNFTSAITFNGSTVTCTIADLYRGS